MDILETIADVVKRQTGQDVTESTDFAGLFTDDVDAVEVLLELEEMFELKEFTDDEYKAISTVRDLVEIITTKVSPEAPAPKVPEAVEPVQAESAEEIVPPAKEPEVSPVATTPISEEVSTLEPVAQVEAVEPVVVPEITAEPETN